jgi:hypothetical protein
MTCDMRFDFRTRTALVGQHRECRGLWKESGTFLLKSAIKIKWKYLFIWTWTDLYIFFNNHKNVEEKTPSCHFCKRYDEENEIWTNHIVMQSMGSVTGITESTLVNTSELSTLATKG